MPRLPQILKFKGNLTQSFDNWINQFEAHLRANNFEDDRFRDVLLCCCEGAAFSRLASAIANDNDLTYEQAKQTLRETYFGDDYKRTLETKLRNMKFTTGMKVTVFTTELCQIIRELYGIDDNEAVKSIAISHVLSTLDSKLKDEVKLLQLSGNLRLENLLEFVDNKLSSNPLTFQHFATKTSVHHSAPPHVTSTNDDIKELKVMMKALLENQLSNSNKQENQQTPKNCEHCGKSGHLSSKCFKIRTCFRCNEKGHISKYCPKSGDEVGSSAGKTELNSNQSDLDVEISSVERIKIKTHIFGTEVTFLYDPGSEYTILPIETYNSLPSKPPLSKINRCGIGINNSKFPIDGVVHLNIDFYRPNVSKYTIPYEPILVSPAFKQPIFGINSINLKVSQEIMRKMS